MAVKCNIADCEEICFCARYVNRCPRRFTVFIDYQGFFRDLRLFWSERFTVFGDCQADRILRQREQPTAQFEHYKAHVFYWIPPNIRDTIGLSHGEIAETPFPEFRISRVLRAGPLRRSPTARLSRNSDCTTSDISHCHLALPNLILGRYPHISYYVGCRIDDPPPAGDRMVAHVIQVGTETVNGISLIVTTVRLFANSGVEGHGLPIYEVVVGAPPLRK